MTKRVPFDQRLWRPEEFQGCEDQENRERLAKHVRDRREATAIPLAVKAIDIPELKDGYLAELRRKITGKPKPDAVEFKPRLDRAMGDKR